MDKSYFELLSDISQDEVYDKLLGFGLFSEKLPPIFQSVEFREYCKNIRKNGFSRVEHSHVDYLSNRNTNVPRNLAIPFPTAYEILCKEISMNWESILTHFKDKTSNQEYKVSRIHLRKLSNRDGLFIMSYKNWMTDGDPIPELLLGKQYEVKCDISQCYPSIYTHSIPWALVGKNYAKKNRDDKKWFNKIDKATRNMKNGETHGILIGPHTSNLLSEVILSSIDFELINNGWEYVRNIDDYTCYVETREKAEAFVVDINYQLREFGLNLNHKKTEILKLPFSNINRWTNILKNSSVNFQKFKDYVDYNEIKSFMELCLSLMEENEENSAILFYGIKILDGLNLTVNAEKYFIKTLVSLSLIYPYLVPLLHQYIFKKYDIESTVKSKYINLIYKKYNALNNYEACSFALFYAFSNGIELQDFDISNIVEKEDCILLLMALIYCKKLKRSDDIKILKNKAKELIENEELDAFWIFIYEALPYSLLQGELKNIKKSGVSFLVDNFK